MLELHRRRGHHRGYAQTLAFYAAKAKDKEAQKLAKELLDRMWAKHREDKGLTNPEVRKDYKRFNEPPYVPPGWKGKMPNGDVIDEESTFQHPIEVQGRPARAR